MTNIAPHAYQLEAIEKLIQHDKALLHGDMGVGKSLILIKALMSIIDELEGPALYVSSKLSTINFLAEMRKHLPKKRLGKHYHTYFGPNRKLPDETDFLITTKDYLKEIPTETFVLIMVDEGHHFVNSATKRYKALYPLTRFASTVWISTGTPIVNYQKDKTALAKLMNIDSDDMEIIRIIKEKVLDLPTKTIHTVNLTDPCLPPLPDHHLARITRIRQVSANNTVKLKWIKDFVTKNPLQNIVIFASFKEPLVPLHKMLGDKCMIFTGDISISSRVDNANTFNKTKGAIALCTYAAAGESINLNSAPFLITLDPVWNPAKSQQAIDRCYRFGKTTTLDVYHLRSDIDAFVQNISDGKLPLY